MNKLLVWGGLGYLGYRLFSGGAKFYEQFRGQLDTQITSIKQVKLKETAITAKVDVRIKNASNQSLILNTLGQVRFQEVRFYTHDGVKLASAIPNASKINVPAHGSTTFKDIPLMISYDKIPNLVGELPGILSSPENLITKLVLQIRGAKLEI